MKVATVPNLICVLRMALTVPIVLFLVEGRFAATLALFAIAAVSDVLDGFLAKNFGWSSELGKILDPLADKILLVSVFITLAWIGLVPAWLAAAAVARDHINSFGAIEYLKVLGPVGGRPTLPSKLNTLLQLSYVIAVVLRAAFGGFPQWAVTALGAMVLVTTVISGLDYVVTYIRKAIAVSRARRPA